jgi:hypothetical protein
MKHGECKMLILDRTIVTVGRTWRSKWWKIACPGCSPSRRRKDGTCKHERRVMEMIEMIDPDMMSRVRIEGHCYGKDGEQCA